MSKGLVALGSDPADFRSIGNGLFGTEGAIPSSLEELINLEQVEEAIFQERQRRYDANIAAEIVLEKTRTDAEAKRLAPAHTDDGSEGMFERSDSQTTTFSEAEERDRPDDADRGREERSEDEDGVRKESVGLERHVAESSSNPPRAEWREKDPAEEAMAHKKRLISLTPLPRLLVAKERDEVAEHCEVVDIKGAVKEIILRQDRSIPALFMVCQGYCEGVVVGDTTQAIATRLMGPGDWFPLASLALDQASPFCVSATTCTLLRLPVAAFKALLCPHIIAEVSLHINCLRDAFGGLTTADAARLLAIGRVHDVKPGALLVEQGDVPVDLLLLVSGEAAMSKDSVPIARVASPHLLGEMSAAANMPCPTRAAASAHSQVVSLVKTDLSALVREFASYKCLASSVLRGAVQNVAWQRQRTHLAASVSMTGGSSWRSDVEEGAEADPRGGGAASRAALERTREEGARGGVHAWRPRSALARLEVEPGGYRGRAQLTRRNTISQAMPLRHGKDVVLGHVVPRTFGPGIFATVPREEDEEDEGGGRPARPQSAFSHRLIGRATVGRLVRPMPSQQLRVAESHKVHSRNLPITALRDVLGDDAGAVLGGTRGLGGRLNRSLKRSNHAQLEAETVRFYKVSDAYLIHGYRAITRSFLGRLQDSAADRMKANAQRQARAVLSGYHKKEELGVKAKNLRGKLEKTIGGFALRYRHPDDVVTAPGA